MAASTRGAAIVASGVPSGSGQVRDGNFLFSAQVSESIRS